MLDTLTPQQLAAHVGEVMFAKDRASIALGMRVANIGPGSATLARSLAYMTSPTCSASCWGVRVSSMLNGQ